MEVLVAGATCFNKVRGPSRCLLKVQPACCSTLRGPVDASHVVSWYLTYFRAVSTRLVAHQSTIGHRRLSVTNVTLKI